MGTLRVDTITDEEGTGAPDFPNGLTGLPQLTTGQATDPDDETFGTVSGSVLLISGNTTTRQTVQSGPVDADGRADFLDVGTGLQVVSDTSAPLNITFGDGFSRGQQRNFGVSIDSALTWDSLPNNEDEVFLFIRALPNGTVETFHSLLAPVYAQARPSAPAAGQTFYPTDHRHRMEVWDGAAWNRDNLIVCVGQCATSGGAVVSVVSYAYGGAVDVEASVAWSPGLYTSAHNIGAPCESRWFALVTTAAYGYNLGELLVPYDGRTADSVNQGVTLTNTDGLTQAAIRTYTSLVRKDTPNATMLQMGLVSNIAVIRTRRSF